MISTEIKWLNQSDLIGFESQALPTLKFQLIRKEDGIGISDQPIMTVISDGNGNVENTSPITDSDGNFEIQWKLGSNYHNSLTIRYTKSDLYSGAERSLSSIARYQYVIPVAGPDWKGADAQESGFDIQTLSAGVDAIRSGKFVRIHDLVLVHQGKLIF